MKPLSTVNRRLGIGVPTIKDVLELAKLRHSSGTVLAVDFQKTLDSLDHSFLVKVLKKKLDHISFSGSRPFMLMFPVVS